MVQAQAVQLNDATFFLRAASRVRRFEFALAGDCVGTAADPVGAGRMSTFASGWCGPVPWRVWLGAGEMTV